MFVHKGIQTIFEDW